MNRQEFENHIKSGSKNDYVDQEAINYFKENAEFDVVERSAMEKSDVPQSAFLSISLPRSNEMTPKELIQKVKENMEAGTLDTQKHQFRDGGVVDYIEIWKHPKGYSAFAFCKQ